MNFDLDVPLKVVAFFPRCFHLRSELYFRVVFRGWECSHSIRSDILLRYWCPDFFLNFFKKYLFDRPKKSWKSRNFSKKILTLFLGNFRFFEILKIFGFFTTFFWSTEKIFFEEVEKNPGIKIEVKCHCGSNGSTPSLWKPLSDGGKRSDKLSPAKSHFFFPDSGFH